MDKLFTPSIAVNIIFGLVAIAMQLGGCVNQFIATILLIVAGLWTCGSILWWWKKRGKKSKITQLANFIPEGENIKKLCYNEWDREPKKEAEEWAERVATFLDSLGAHYRPTFFSDDGLGSPNIKSQWISREHRELSTWVSHRLMRINEFLAELRKK